MDGLIFADRYFLDVYEEKKNTKKNSWLPHQNTNKKHSHNCRAHEWIFAFFYVTIDKCEDYWLVA